MLNSLPGYRCTLVPKLAFLVPSFPFSVFRSPFKNKEQEAAGVFPVETFDFACKKLNITLVPYSRLTFLTFFRLFTSPMVRFVRRWLHLQQSEHN